MIWSLSLVRRRVTQALLTLGLVHVPLLALCFWANGIAGAVPVAIAAVAALGAVLVYRLAGPAIVTQQVIAVVLIGQVSIHSLSAAAIDSVSILDGEDRPVLIEITMNNSSGLYQVDGLLKEKLRGSGLEPYVDVVAHIDTEEERRLVPMYRLDLGS